MRLLYCFIYFQVNVFFMFQCVEYDAEVYLHMKKVNNYWTELNNFMNWN